jgi:hypothetical protein
MPKTLSVSAIKAALLTLICLSPVQGQTQPTLQKDVKVYVSVMDPATVADVFGRRIGDRFVAIQITITNQSKDFQLLIHDVSLDLRKIYFPESTTIPQDIKEELECERNAKKERRDAAGNDGRRGERENKGRRNDEQCYSRNRFEISSLELSLLRGVAEKGQGQDPRNKILRLFRGVGTVAAGLIGVASFGPSYAESVAVFNGPVLSAYMDTFPDYTINQLNRLNDSAYKSNSLVPKQQAKVLVAFIPQLMFMNKKQRKLFKSDPLTLAVGKEIDFRRAEALVDGAFITELEDMPPMVSGVQIERAELEKFQDAAPEVRGSIVGRLLTGSKISLVGVVPDGATVEVEGTPADKRLDFIVKSTQPIPPGTPLTFEVSNAQGVQTITRPMLYTPQLPTLTGVEPDPAEGEAGSEVTLTLKGANFIPNTNENPRVTRVIPQTGSGVRVVSVEVTGATSLEVTLSISANAPRAASKLRVANPAGQSAGSVPFVVTAPSNP